MLPDYKITTKLVSIYKQPGTVITVGTRGSDYSIDGVHDQIQINQASLQAYNAGGGVVMVKNDFVIGAPIIKYPGVLLTSPSLGSVVGRLANNSNCNMIESYNFNTYTGTGNVTGQFGYGGISNLILDGNKANQSSGKGIVLYDVCYLLEDLIIYGMKEDGIYSEYSNNDTQPTNLPYGYIESIWKNVRIEYCGGDAFEYRGPHDSKFIQVITRWNGGEGMYFTGGTNQGCGGIKLTQCQSYANSLNALKVGDSISSNVSIEAVDCQFDGTIASSNGATINTSLNSFSCCKFYGGSATGAALHIAASSNSI